MNLKKSLFITLLFCFNISLFAIDWFSIADQTLATTPEPQVSYWLEIIKNGLNAETAKPSAEYSNILIHKGSEYVIAENFVNDEGKARKGREKSHSYHVGKDSNLPDKEIVSLSIFENGDIYFFITISKKYYCEITIKNKKITYSYRTVNKEILKFQYGVSDEK